MIKLKDILNEKLDPYKDFSVKDRNKKYDFNLGAFVGAYQDFIKFMKTHKEVPDGNKKEWALQIREKVGQAQFNGYIGLFTQPIKVLERFKKFEKLKNKDFHFTEGKQINEAKELDQKSIDFIAKLTHYNNHTRSRLELAQHMNDKRLIKAYQGLIYVQDLLGDANDISKARLRLDKQLWYKAKKMYSNFDAIYKAY